MADRLEQLIEMECADALLDSGVSVPLKRWKLPWLKRPVEVRVTMKRPRLWGQILLAREYLKMGVQTRVASEGQGRGTGLCSGAW